MIVLAKYHPEQNSRTAGLAIGTTVYMPRRDMRVSGADEVTKDRWLRHSPEYYELPRSLL